MPETDGVKLLFLDTFLHQEPDLNLDLVQFPCPVCVTEIRIIPLGSKVTHPAICGGTVMGATNPSKFLLELFVNDLANPGAATFETLGSLEYNQSSAIRLVCDNEIPTDGLVLRGKYTAITLAVLGYKAVIQVTDQKPVDPSSPPVITASADAAYVVAEVANDLAFEQALKTEVEDAQMNDFAAPAEIPNKEHDFLLPAGAPDNIVEERATDFSRDEVRVISPDRHSGIDIDDEQSEQYFDEHLNDEDDGNKLGEKTRSRSRSLSRSCSRSSSRTRSPPLPPADNYGGRGRSVSSSASRRSYSGSGDARRRARGSPRVKDSRRRTPRSRSSSPARSPIFSGRSSKTARGDDRKRRRGDRLSSIEHHADAAASGRYVRTGSRSSGSGDEERDVKSYRKDESSRKFSRSRDRRRRDSDVAVDARRLGSASSLGVKSGGSSPEHPLPLASTYQDFEEIVSDDDLPEETGDDDVNDYQQDDELTGLKQFDPLAVTEFDPLICIPDPTLAEGELETRKLLLLRTFDSMKESDDEVDSQSRQESEPSLPAAKKLARLVEAFPEPETTSQWVNAVEDAIPYIPKAVAQLMYIENAGSALRVLLSWAEFGTDFEAAIEQTERNYVLRHLKAGVRLSSAICSCSPAIASRLLLKSIQHRLLNLYEQEHMSTPMRLLIVQALDKTLDLKLGFDLAVRVVRRRRRKPSGMRSESEAEADAGWEEDFEDDLMSGDDDAPDVFETAPSLYDRLCRLLLAGPSLSRLRVAILRLLNKVHFWELMDCLSADVDGLLGDASAYSQRRLVRALASMREVQRVYRCALTSIAQPGQQLPARRQFRIPPPASDPYRGIFAAFQSYSLLEALHVIACLPGPMRREQRARVTSFLDELSGSLRGLAFLNANAECLAALLRVLMPRPPRNEVDEDERPEWASAAGDEGDDLRAQMLGVQIIYYLRVRLGSLKRSIVFLS